MQTLKTIEARLIPSEWFPANRNNFESIAVASESARQMLLQLSIASTQLGKVLNDQISQHPEFETWRNNGSIPVGVLKDLWDLERSQAPYKQIPERFNRSAWLSIKNIYAGWFKTQKKLLNKLNGLNRWLGIIKSDHELVEMSKCELEEIQSRATQIASEIRSQLREAKQSTDGINHLSNSATNHAAHTDNEGGHTCNESTESSRSLANKLFKVYFSLVETDGSLFDRCAIVHLLKNGCKVATKPEDSKKFSDTCRKNHKKAERIEKQLAARMPKVRDLGEKALKALSDGLQVVTLDNAEFVAQLAELQRKLNPLPYPVLLYSGSDVEWHLIKRRNPTTQDIEERIFVKFRGLNTYLKKQAGKQIEKQIEEQLVELDLNLDDVEWKIVRSRNKVTQEFKERISVKLEESKKYLKQQLEEKLKKLDLKKYELGKEYVFEIYCDRRQLQEFQTFLSDWQIYSSDRKKYPITLFAFQSAALIWRQSTKDDISTFQPYLKCTFDQRCLTAERAELARAEDIAKVNRKINNYEAAQKDSQALTENQQKDLKNLKGQLAALDNPYPRPSKPSYKGNPNIILGVCFSIEQVVTVAVVDCSAHKAITYRSIRQLLGRDYEKLAAYRLRQGRNANERHKQQKRGKVSNLSESNEGKYIDRLIAKAIVEVAQEFKAGRVVLPKLTGLRESLQSKLEAKAEERHPGDRAKQQEYEEQYKINLHRWSYKRLTQCIEERAGKIGVPIELGQQQFKGNFKEKAMQIVWSTHQAHKDVGT